MLVGNQKPSIEAGLVNRWTRYCGEQPPERIQNVYNVVTGARDAAIKKVQVSIVAGYPLRGFEVDDACRGRIKSHGFGEYFTHPLRTFHWPGSTRQRRQYGQPQT
jgi:Xaa-Pro aminopeptidase